MFKSAFLSSGVNDAQRGHSALLPFYAESRSNVEVKNIYRVHFFRSYIPNIQRVH